MAMPRRDVALEALTGAATRQDYEGFADPNRSRMSSEVTFFESHGSGPRSPLRKEEAKMYSIFRPHDTVHPWNKPRRKGRAVKGLLLLLGILAAAPLVRGQQSTDSTAFDKATMQLLLQRIAQLEAKVEKVDQLEARIKELEAARAQSSAAAGTGVATAPPVVSAPGVSTVTTSSNASVASAQQNTPQENQSEATSEHMMSERMDVSKTLLRIRGFGDIGLYGDDLRGGHTSFTLGQLNLFITSDISEKFKFLSEIVFEGGPDNIYGVYRGQNNAFGVDVERMLLQYSYNDYFHLAVGRYHTAIGYYNTEFHHSTWFQTTEDRPFLFQFEDRGGILPIHNVGASASGLIPSGPLGLHYVVEVGNGRESRSPLTEEPVQNVIDENNRQAVNVAVFARPEGVRGLQTGFSVYRDVLTPLAQPKIGETILAAHAVLVRSRFQWLNEALMIRHAPEGVGHVFNTSGFYTQVGEQFGVFTPYFRYQYVNAPVNEPVFPEVGLQRGPSIGLRYDASESVAVKLQYNYMSLRGQPSVNSLGLQVGFTF